VTRDLDVIIVSIPGQPEWLEPCLKSVHEHAGSLDMSTIIVDSDDSPVVRELAGRYPETKVITCENFGFGHANNRALAESGARYVLFLNPDTEFRTGSLEDLIARMDARPGVGLVGVRHVTQDGEVYPSMRRFPNVRRALFEALACEAWGSLGARLGERVLDVQAYDQDLACQWSQGSFLLCRAKAIASAGWFDERFFLYSEETDLCARVRQAGYEVRYWPHATVMHHTGTGAVDPRLEAQKAYSRALYSRKHFGPARHRVYWLALVLRYSLRSVTGYRRAGRSGQGAARRALEVLLGRSAPPFEPAVDPASMRRVAS
jgi:hypothetical protein